MFQIFRRWFRSYCSKPVKAVEQSVVSPIASRKSKSKRRNQHYFIDLKTVRVLGGKGGNGCVSFLKLWCNERAGPDGGCGGNGGHVILKASKDVKNLNHLPTAIRGESGHSGNSKQCHGSNGRHTLIKVPVGTIVRAKTGVIIGDLDQENMMFVLARGGAGGKGNTLFASDIENSPKIFEQGALGEENVYTLEMRIVANIGLVGFPNAGKSTLLNAITRARSKVAPYAYTTLYPQVGTVEYADHFQLAVADLPGIISGSHNNNGLGLQFLKHVERCTVLLYLLDASFDDPCLHYEELSCEISKFNQKLQTYPKIIVANKIDKDQASINVHKLMKVVDGPVIGISAKQGINLTQLLNIMRITYENATRK